MITNFWGYPACIAKQLGNSKTLHGAYSRYGGSPFFANPFAQGRPHTPYGGFTLFSNPFAHTTTPTSTCSLAWPIGPRWSKFSPAWFRSNMTNRFTKSHTCNVMLNCLLYHQTPTSHPRIMDMKQTSTPYIKSKIIVGHLLESQSTEIRCIWKMFARLINPSNKPRELNPSNLTGIWIPTLKCPKLLIVFQYI